MIDITGLREDKRPQSSTIVHALLDRLEAAEKSDAESLAMYRRARDERDALRAKVERMEQQEQARLVTPTAYRWRYRGAIKWQYGELTEEAARLAKEHNHEVQPLYALPCAKGEKMFAWLKRIFDQSADPVHSCDLYHDKEAGSCVHVDGPLCNFPECSMLADYQQQKEKRND